MDDLAYFGSNLRYFRHLRGWSQRVLAESVSHMGTELPQWVLSDFERGLRPSSEQVDVCASALGVPREALLRRPRIVHGTAARAIVMAAKANTPMCAEA